MNILFLSIVRFLDIEDRGIYTDLMRKFKTEGHNVFVVYPAERRFEESTLLREKDNVIILSVKTLNIQKTNFIEKGIATITLEWKFLKEIKRHFNHVKFDLVVYSTPPITFAKIIKYIKQKDSATSYLLLKDIFPQNAVDLSILKKKGLIYRYFRRKEVELYKVSDFIGCMSPANVNYLIQHNPQIDSKKVEVNPNSIEPRCIKLSPEEKKLIRSKYNITDDTTTFIYGGNLGKPQGVPFLIEVLKANRDQKGVFFVVVGDGTEFIHLSRSLKSLDVTNVLLMKSLPKNEYDSLVASCDVGLIFLHAAFTIPNFPSRLLSYMEVELPVLAATDSNTDIGTIMQDNNFGLWVKSGDIQGFNNNLAFYLNHKDKLTAMGKNGYNFMINNYQVSYSYQMIIDKLKNV